MKNLPERGLETATALSRRGWLKLTAMGLALTHLPLASFAQTAGGTAAGTANPGRTRSNGLALLVGNTDYNPNEEDLPPAHKCLVALDERLRQYGFSTTVLHDAPVARVIDELDRLQRAVAADPTVAVVFYFVGHGFQSDGENVLVPAGSDLTAEPQSLALHCLSVDRHVFPRLERSAGRAATVILIDACRTPDRPRSANEGYNQTMPPDGCHVAFATGPGQRAFAPSDPQRFTFFAEALVSELDVSTPSRSVLQTLEGVRVKVAHKVNNMPTILQAFGPDAQTPELASNVQGDPAWIATAGAGAAARRDTADGPVALVFVGTLPAAGVARLKTMGLLADLGDDEVAAAIASVRLDEVERADRAVRKAGLDDAGQQAATAISPRVAEDANRALRGDKYAALRVAEALPLPGPGELIERTAYGQWMRFAAYLGNGIAAYRLSLYFRNGDHRDVEAIRYLNLARDTHYTPPRQLRADR
jgi:hypothetical protein